jgi:hypothetical protein
MHCAAFLHKPASCQLQLQKLYTVKNYQLPLQLVAVTALHSTQILMDMHAFRVADLSLFAQGCRFCCQSDLPLHGQASLTGTVLLEL